jgi:S-adenosyl methyltransferase
LSALADGMEGFRMVNGEDIDTTRPSPARVYDYLLGGKDHYAVDREAATQALAAFPRLQAVAQTNRTFLVRTVRYLAEQGVTQFLDIGTGLPTSPTVYEVTSGVRPQARVVGVDNDRVVTRHYQAHAQTDVCRYCEGDVRRPTQLLALPDLRQVLDFDRPVAVLLVAVLHLISDADDPAGIVGTLREAMAPGSALVLSHLTRTGSDPQVLARMDEIFKGTPGETQFRTAEEISGWCDGLDIAAPGLVNVQMWRPDRLEQQTTGLRVIGGVWWKR